MDIQSPALPLSPSAPPAPAGTVHPGLRRALHVQVPPAQFLRLLRAVGCVNLEGSTLVHAWVESWAWTGHPVHKIEPAHELAAKDPSSHLCPGRPLSIHSFLYSLAPANCCWTVHMLGTRLTSNSDVASPLLSRIGVQAPCRLERPRSAPSPEPGRWRWGPRGAPSSRNQLSNTCFPEITSTETLRLVDQTASGPYCVAGTPAQDSVTMCVGKESERAAMWSWVTTRSACSRSYLNLANQLLFSSTLQRVWVLICPLTLTFTDGCDRVSTPWLLRVPRNGTLSLLRRITR